MAKEGVRHLYHGFRLFGVNTKLAWRYSRRLQSGQALTRRERLLLERATLDLLRLVPFTFFVVVPFAEFLLPVALKMFPTLIPSTFETESQGRTRAYRGAMRTLLARKKLLEHMTSVVLATNPEHADILRRASCGDTLTPEHIRVIAPFCDKVRPLSLGKLPPELIVELGKTVGVYHPIYRVLPKAMIAQRVRADVVAYTQKLKRDDLQLDAEGMGDLPMEELIKANQQRGMRWTESKDTLLVQLEWWVELAKDPKVRYGTLFWIKPTRFNLRKSMTNLPLDQRRQFLGIHTLPSNVRDNLELLCDKVDRKPNNELKSDADSLAAEVDVIATQEQAAGKDTDQKEVRDALAVFLTEANIDTFFRTCVRPDKKELTVSDAVEYIAGATHMGSHGVSTVFDAFNLDQGSAPIVKANLLALAKRCRDDSSVKIP